MNAKQFASLLARHGVVDHAAVVSPDGYDHGATLARIEAAYAELPERAALLGLMRALNETPDVTGNLERATRAAYNAARELVGEPT